MATEAAPTADTDTETEIFGTNLGAIFDKIDPPDEEEETTPAKPVEKAPVEEKKPIAEVRSGNKVSEPVETEPFAVPDSLFTGEPEKKETPVAEEPVLEEPPASIKSKEARENFSRLAKEAFEAKKALIIKEKAVNELQGRLEAGNPDQDKRIKELEATIQQYSQKVAIADVKLHPEFQARYEIPRQQMMDRAQMALKDAGVDPGALETALNLYGRPRAEKLDEIYAEITSPTLRGRIERAVDGIEQLDSQKDLVLKNGQAWLKQAQANEAVNRSKFLEEHETRTKATLDEAHRILRDVEGWEILKKVDDPKFSAWNDNIDKIQKAAFHIMTKVDDPVQMNIAAEMAAAAPTWMALAKNNLKRALKAEKALAEYKQSDPGIGGTQKSSTLTSDEENDEPTVKDIARGISKIAFAR